MKQKFLFILKIAICLFFTAVAAVAYIHYKDKKEKENLSMANLLQEFSADAPAELVISWKTNKTTLVLTDGVWYIKERGNHKADMDKVVRFIEGLQKIRPLRKAVPADDKTCSMLRVKTEESDSNKIPGVRVQVFDKNKKSLRDITLGAGYFNETETVMPGREPEPSGRWAGIVQSDGTVIPVLISTMFEEFTPVPGNWMSCPVFSDIVKLTRIEFNSKTKDASNWMIGRFNEKDPFESVIPGESRVSARKLNTLVSVLSQRYIYEGIREKDAGKMVPVGELATRDRTGFVRKLTFYRAENAKGGVVCRVSAEKAGADVDMNRVKEFLDGREGWLYVIPDKIFEVLKTDPAGE